MNKKGKILIVDDDESTCVLLSRIIRKKGYDVEIAYSGREALIKVKTYPANLVILDIRLPDMEGTDLLPDLKVKYSNIDIIIMTGHASVDNSMKALNRGAVAFLVKPLDIDQLLALINSLMEKQQLHNEKIRNEQKVKHLFDVLTATRSINKLLLRASDLDNLVQGICDTLIQTRGFGSSWIILTDHSNRLITSASAGMGEYFIMIIDQFKAYELPECCRLAVENEGSLIINDPDAQLPSCGLPKKLKDHGIVINNLVYDDKTFGFLSVSVPRIFIRNTQLLDLIEDISGDMSHVLNTLVADSGNQGGRDNKQEMKLKK